MMAYFSFLIRRLKEDGEYHEEEMVFAEGETFFEAVTVMLQKMFPLLWGPDDVSFALCFLSGPENY